MSESSDRDGEAEEVRSRASKDILDEDDADLVRS